LNAAPASSIELALRPTELVAHWKRCSLTADWISSYLAHDFEPKARATAKNALSTVANELLENAVKFRADEQTGIKIAAGRHGGFVRIETWNAAPDARARLLASTLEELARGSLDSMFAQRVAGGRVPGAPGIGLLIIKRDYGARLDAKLTPRSNGALDVHVSVELDVARLESV